MLTSDQSLALISAGVLLGRAADVLAPFEQELVAEVCQRWLDHRDQVVITDAEWIVIEASIEAMRPIVRARVEAFEAEQAA